MGASTGATARVVGSLILATGALVLAFILGKQGWLWAVLPLVGTSFVLTGYSFILLARLAVSSTERSARAHSKSAKLTAVSVLIRLCLGALGMGLVPVMARRSLASQSALGKVVALVTLVASVSLLVSAFRAFRSGETHASQPGRNEDGEEL